MWQQHLERTLHQFGQGLKHPDEYDEEAVQLADKVFRKLRENVKKFKIANTYFGGSFGKKTDVLSPDLDLVVLVNFNSPEEYEKLRNEVLEQFEDILTMHSRELKIRNDEIKMKKNIQFVFNNGVEADLLVAGKFTKDEIYREIEKDPSKTYFYGSCLVKQTLEFMSSQNSFAHSLVRVLRFWYKMLHLDFSGGKMMMELIGVAAAKKQNEYGSSASILGGLATAFTWISRLESLKLAFVEDKGEWRQVSDQELKNVDALVRNRIIGTREILGRKGFIIDPVNPSNDLLQNVDENAMKILKKYAGSMKERLAKAAEGLDYCRFDGASRTVHFDMFKLFTPEIAKMKIFFPAVKTPFVYLGFDYPVTSAYPDMKVWNESRYGNKDIRAFVEAVRWDLLARVNSIQEMVGGTANNNISDADMKTTTAKLVQEMVEDSLKVKLGPTQLKRHEDQDITVTVPYEVGNKYYAVKLSMKWD